jgi:hypothetical protein
MEQPEALKHLRKLINVASESDDIDAVHKLLREMSVVVEKALPIARRSPWRPYRAHPG